MLNQARFKKHNSSEQGSLLPVYSSDLVPEDHLARAIGEIVDSLDLSKLYHKYSWEGGASFHPKCMFKILTYAYSQGDRSSRQIQKLCQENFVYMFLGSGIKPNFRTISEFRRKNLDILKDIFKQIVHICYKLGMVTVGKISIDGTKIKANASNGNIVNKDDLEKELKEIEKEISAILAEAESVDNQEDSQFGSDKTGNELPEKLQKTQDRKQEIMSLLKQLEEKEIEKMSLTDANSRFMKSHGRLQLSYNAQCATENQVILSCNLNNQEDDTDQLEPMIIELEEMATELTNKKDYPLENSIVVTDSGYDSGKNLPLLKERKIDGYVSNPQGKVRAKEKRGDIAPRPFSKDKFTYHSEENYYECPAGQRLDFTNKQKNKKATYTQTKLIYKGKACHQCSSQKECTTSKKGYRQITRFEEYDHFREKMDEKIATPTGKAIMINRFVDVEPTFGQLKQAVFRFNPFLLRGNIKVKGEFRLACIVHNLKKIANYLKKTNPSNDSLNMNYYGIKMA